MIKFCEKLDKNTENKFSILYAIEKINFVVIGI
jgi:hypothetical protein